MLTCLITSQFVCSVTMGYSLTSIYRHHIKDKCAPSIISNTAKFIPPKIASMHIPTEDVRELPTPTSDDHEFDTFDPSIHQRDASPNHNSLHPG